MGHSLLPTGIGVVEGTMALALVSLGIVKHRAAVVAVAYRGISFWLPFLLGMLSLRL